MTTSLIADHLLILTVSCSIDSYEVIFQGHSSLTEVRFDWVASVFTPHALKVHSTDWTIIKEHSVKLIVVEFYKQK